MVNGRQPGGHAPQTTPGVEPDGPLAGVLQQLLAGALARAAVGSARQPGASRHHWVLPPTFDPFLVAALAADRRFGGAARRVLLVTPSAGEAEEAAAAIIAVLGPLAVAVLPAWETLPHERLSPSTETMGQRIDVLQRLHQPGTALRVVTTSSRALLQPQVAGLLGRHRLRLAPGDTVGLEALAADLQQLGYSRVDLVERRGQYAVRGGLVDVFPATAEHPCRIELFGDEVDEIRTFAVADQRSLGLLERIEVSACRELLLTPEVRARAGSLLAQYPGLTEVLGPVADGISVPGLESLAPVLAEGLELLVDVVPPDTLVLVRDPERVRRRGEDLRDTDRAFTEASWAAAATGGAIPVDLGGGDAFRELDEVGSAASAAGLPWWTASAFTDQPAEAPGSSITTVGPYRGDTTRAVADLRAWLAAGARVVVAAQGAGTVQRIGEVLAEAGLPTRSVGRLDEVPTPDLVHLVQARLGSGFFDPAAGLVLLSERDLSGRGGASNERTRLPSRRRHQVDPLALEPGDFVVHDQHGVGRYVELTQRTVGGAAREYLVVEYSPRKRGQAPDRLYVPTDQLEQLSRYVGGDDPALDRMGGSDWTKRKGRARKAVREIAAELIKLYAARQAAKGHAFGPDSPWQRELEDAFGYVETPDQLATIDEVKRDMERAVPMDRVICGDVGYGKTEIAVRAAFKAVQDGKQVAVLVPTTLLVQQHLQTFAERYAAFPVRVAALSRFQTGTEADQVRHELLDGQVDVVIGTHRLLSKDVRYRDLGLVIVDEEQRFGVEHKEQLKHLRANVDVLTMSATPIPRTLEMSVTGIRDMSTITTPPEERHPVLTAVTPYDNALVAAAVRRELVREGQVFYVHNRVADIERVAVRLRELVPEARVAVAHGQLPEQTLEQVILDFWERRSDVLVCTTIVETGLDIANANTLVVERADMFGLSQLHQLRGRVGRGRERGYAYFCFPPDAALTETAHARLSTIAQHTALGSGMAVAMKDLEIRGAGNLLGAEQSGHIADVGFDLYLRMVGEAVAEFRGEASAPEPEMRLDLPVQAHLPVGYVSSERLRMEAYRRLAQSADTEALQAAQAELVDRYGPMPPPVQQLVRVAALRARARGLGVHEIVAQGPNIRLSPVALTDSQQVRLTRLFPKALIKAHTRMVLVPRPKASGAGLSQRLLEGEELLAWVDSLLDALEPVRVGGSGVGRS